jgi:hypothetical protein
MKKSLLTIMIFFATVSCYAQNLPWFLNHDGNKYQYAPLYIIHTPDTVIKTHDHTVFKELLSPYIYNLKILKGPAAIKAYGQSANHGVVEVHYRDDVMLDTVDHVNLYDMITEMDMGIKTILPIYIDHIYIKYPKDVYLDKTKLASVEQRTEKAYHNATYFSVITQKFVADSTRIDSVKRASMVKKIAVDTTK